MGPYNDHSIIKRSMIKQGTRQRKMDWIYIKYQVNHEEYDPVDKMTSDTKSISNELRKISAALKSRQLPNSSSLTPSLNDLRVCTLCYHPGEILHLKCQHTVCVDCTKTKLSSITPSRLTGKIFCPICGYFVGRKAETAEIATQTWNFTSKMDGFNSSRRSSYDSGFEDISEEPLSTSTPHHKQISKRLFDFSGVSIARTISEETDFDLTSEDESPKFDDDERHLRNAQEIEDQDDKGSVDKWCKDDDSSDTEGMRASKQYVTTQPSNGHTFELQESAEETPKPKQKCWEHNHCTSKYFCQTCDHHICLGCKVGEHKYHQVIPIRAYDKLSHISVSEDEGKEAVHSEPIEDSVFPENTEDHVLELQAWIEELQNYTQLLQQKQRKAMSRLTERRDYLRQFVDRWYAKTSLQIETLFQKEIAVIADTELQIKDSIKQHENSAEATNVRDVTLEHLSPANFASIAEDLTVVMSFGVGLTYDMLGSFSASYLKPSEESSSPCPVSNFEESFSQDSYSVPSSTTSHCSSCSIDVPALKFLPKPSIHFIGQGQEMRAFETRDSSRSENCDYVATGLSLLKDGRVMVSDMGTDAVKVFSTAGRFLQDITTLPDDQATKAVQLDNGDIAVATKSAIKLYEQDGTFRHKAGNIESPQALAAAPNGNILVSDTIDNVNQIVTYRPDFETHVHVFNSRSQVAPEHQFHQPWYVATNTNNDIFVSDRADHCVKVYSRHGIFRWMAGGRGAAPGQLFRPAGLVVDTFGHVLVADSGNHRIQVFSPAGDWLGIILDEEQHELDTPMDLAINSAGHLMVLQADGKVRVFKYLI